MFTYLEMLHYYHFGSSPHQVGEHSNDCHREHRGFIRLPLTGPRKTRE